MSSRYTKKFRDDGSTEFSVYRSPMWKSGIFGWIVTIGVLVFSIPIVTLMLFAVFGQKFGALAFIVLMVGLIFAQWMHIRSLRLKGVRNCKFSASPTHITTMSRNLAVSEIAQLRVGHAFPISFYDTGSNVSGAISRGAHTVKTLAGYRVEAIVGGAPVVLAGGLEEHTASALQQDVSRIVNFAN